MPRGKFPDSLQVISIRFIARKIDIWCPNPADFYQIELSKNQQENEKSTRTLCNTVGHAASGSSFAWGMASDIEEAASHPECVPVAVPQIVSPALARLPGPYTRPIGFSSQPARLPVILPIPPEDSFSRKSAMENDDHAAKELYEAYIQRSCELFELLSAQMVQGLIDNLITRCNLAFHHLDVLVHSRLTRLSLVHTPNFTHDDDIIDIVSDRCQNLSRLCLNLPKCQSPEKLMDLIAANPNLVFLNLSLTNTCTDAVLETIGKHCPKIKEILVSSCPVTDSGIAHLIGDADSGEPACPELLTLDLRRTTVSAVGVQMALGAFKNLQNVYHMGVITALCMLHSEENIGRNQIRTHKLRTLESFFGRPANNLGLAISHCPFITDINLYECTQRESLTPLRVLRHLKKLALKTSRNCFPLERMDFQSEVLLVLESVGAQLENLQLVSFEDIDLSAIIYLCKDLQTLIVDISRIQLDDPFQSNSEYREKLKQKDSNFIPMRYLETLNIITGMNCATVPDDCLKALLTNCPNLTNLILDGVANLDSDMVARILGRNPMNNLRKLELCNCPLLTVKGVEQFLMVESPLEKLDVTQCNLLTHADREHLRKYLDAMHYDLAFTMIVSNWS